MGRLKWIPGKKRTVQEFSKRAIIALFVLCVGMILFACIMIVWAFFSPERVLPSVDTVLITSSTLLTGGVLGYLIKSGRENPEKIKAQNALDIAKLRRELQEVKTGEAYTPFQKNEEDTYAN